MNTHNGLDWLFSECSRFALSKVLPTVYPFNSQNQLDSNITTTMKRLEALIPTDSEVRDGRNLAIQKDLFDALEEAFIDYHVSGSLSLEGPHY